MTATNDDLLLRERLVAMTRDLILIPSIPSRPDDLRRCYEFVKNHVDALDGIRVDEYESAGHRSLVAMPVGESEPAVLLCAHLDVITHPDLAFYRSEVRQGRIVGPGAGDMKGALGILLDLFLTIHHAAPRASLGIAVTSDEELGGEHGIGYLFDAVGLRCGTALVPDGGSLNEVTVDEKGLLHLRLRTLGTAAHAARPWLGVNAIDRLSEALHRVRSVFDTPESDDSGESVATCAVTVIDTENSTCNRIPSEASAILDIRFPAPYTAAQMRARVAQAAGPEVHLERIIEAEPTHLQPDPDYLAVIEAVTGSPARMVREAGASDARFIGRYGIPVQMSRPLVGNLHAADEWIDIDSMVVFHRICERYLRLKLELR